MDSVKGMSKIEQLRYQTYLEAKELLDCYGKACIVRPTGFGKTGILTRLIKDYTKLAKGSEITVLFLYPSDPVLDAVLEFYYGTRSYEYRRIPNVKTITYRGILQMSNETMRGFSNVKLIVTDECHLTGAKETSVALTRLLKALPNAALVGATATPVRMDEFDEVSYFYDNRIVSSYSLTDAFEDGVIKRPYYCYCSYIIKNNIDELKKDAFKKLKGISSKEKNDILKKLEPKFIEMARISKMDKIIRETLDKYVEDKNYMKGIFFFKNNNHLKEAKPQVVNWFKKAYPDYSIRTLTVSTDTSETSNNRFKLSKMKKQDKTIDIICSINILNMGYHVGDLTFLGMFRGTKSATLFSQQLGRALSSGDVNPCVIFDLVDNLHSKALTQALDRKTDGDIGDKARYLELREKMLKLSDGAEDVSVLSDDEQEEFVMLRKIFEKLKGPKCTSISNVNKLYREDLIVTSHQATMDEMISKIVIEPKNIVCKQAYNMWKEYGGDDSGGTPDYILNTCLEEGKTPITPFCAIKGVSLVDVLTVIFGARNYKGIVEKHLAEAKKRNVCVKL